MNERNSTSTSSAVERVEHSAEFKQALAKFKDASCELLETWMQEEGRASGETNSYPEHWMSFDEEVCHVLSWWSDVEELS